MAQANLKDIKAKAAENQRGCPFWTGKGAMAIEQSWWPNKLSLKPLGKATPLSVGDVNAYALDVAALDVDALKSELVTLIAGNPHCRLLDSFPCVQRRLLIKRGVIKHHLNFCLCCRHKRQLVYGDDEQAKA